MDDKIFPAGIIPVENILQMSLPRNRTTISADILISEPLASDLEDYITSATMTVSRVGFHAIARNYQNYPTVLRLAAIQGRGKGLQQKRASFDDLVQFNLGNT
jgi:hypothetical protein